MKSRVFVNKVEIEHLNWLSVCTGVPISYKGGVDLANEAIGIELKSRLLKPRSIEPYPNFAVHEYQFKLFPEEKPDRELFWAFMLYNLDIPISSIRGDSDLNKDIVDRRVWIFDWEPKAHKLKEGG